MANEMLYYICVNFRGQSRNDWLNDNHIFFINTLILFTNRLIFLTNRLIIFMNRLIIFMNRLIFFI